MIARGQSWSASYFSAVASEPFESSELLPNDAVGEADGMGLAVAGATIDVGLAAAVGVALVAGAATVFGAGRIFQNAKSPAPTSTIAASAQRTPSEDLRLTAGGAASGGRGGGVASATVGKFCSSVGEPVWISRPLPK